MAHATLRILYILDCEHNVFALCSVDFDRWTSIYEILQKLNHFKIIPSIKYKDIGLFKIRIAYDRTVSPEIVILRIILQNTYEVLEVLNFCWIIDVFRCGTVSGVGIASPVGKTPAGFGLAVYFCFAI